MRIDLPAPNVTSCAFGGEDLRTLYITTAKDDMTPAEAARASLAGGLFAARPGPRGLLEPVFEG
jgi:sugar lactone lactonase YvrE